MEDRTVLSHGCRKTNKLICGMEGENVMAYGLLPARLISRFFFKLTNIICTKQFWLNKEHVFYVNCDKKSQIYLNIFKIR